MAENHQLHSPDNLPVETAESYRRAMRLLNEAGISFFIGGAYALAHHSGIVRHTKDLDVFLKAEDRNRALATLDRAGYETEIRYEYWLAKAFQGEDMVDLIYRSPNGVSTITDEWLERAVRTKVLGVPAKLCSAEHMVLSKCYVMNNDRNDLADVMHLLLGAAGSMDWEYLLKLFAKHPRLLLGHLILFGFVYPSERHLIPSRYVQQLLDEVRSEDATLERVCNGTLLSHSQYRKDIEENGFIDGRHLPHGSMTVEDVINATRRPDEVAAAAT
jgi:predicted nucleotidyltransferase